MKKIYIRNKNNHYNINVVSDIGYQISDDNWNFTIYKNDNFCEDSKIKIKEKKNIIAIISASFETSLLFFLFTSTR